MDLDDGPKRKDTPMEAVEAEKLGCLSVDELAYRIRVLKRETLRSEAELEEKAASKAAAEDVFKRLPPQKTRKGREGGPPGLSISGSYR